LAGLSADFLQLPLERDADFETPMKVEAIAKREDTSPSEGKSKYGDVTFADEKNKKYPIDTEAHVRAALSYWGNPDNRAKYSAEDQKTIGAKIRAAAKKFGIAVEDKKTEAQQLVSCDFSSHQFENGTTPGEIVYMPKGVWNISTQQGQKTVEVTADTAARLQASLNEREQEPRPYAGFGHDEKGPASFLPKAFKWDEQKGVVLEVDWTQAGKAAVEGRNYSYFSPSFMLSGRQVAGLPSHGEVGSLVNNPAFRKIRRIAASHENTLMSTVANRLVELEVITAQEAEGADEELLVRAINGLHEELKATQAANAQLKSEKLSLEAKVQAVAKSEAETVVQAAIAEGKIGIKDQTAIDFWTDQLLRSPDTAKKVLASLPKNEALTTIVNVTAKAQHRAVRSVQERQPGLSHSDAFNRAKEERPELFVRES
jgi:phage I-like protein